ncbi:hypothetical protein N780_17585 [Pontibacillus chungwhensis BH030062]|uniref:Uncharacterized protein n=1 Tax=Pontibacillus chungwhensis BH030062 TaxID=1385513 RepID=A0A0A2UT02_9BACI|nr:hypothetical protein [Pontibacillus chungwhensis]KGP91069.1 hypothetical protein N780_17585 [Pontibacillus chungwhensis BH030062]
MSKRAFHIYNIIILLLLLFMNLLVLFAFGISEGGINLSAILTIVLSFALWGAFYLLQFMRDRKVWRVSWLCVMVVVLYFWQTGLGASFGRWIV